MSADKYDFFFPLSLTVNEFDEMQEQIRALKELYSINHTDEFGTGALIADAVDFYYRTVFALQAKPDPLLDNIETP